MADDSSDDVKNWGLPKTIEWLEKNNVSDQGLQNLEQLHDLVRAEMDKKIRKKYDSDVYNKLHVEMANILAKNTQMKEEIVHMYDALIAFFGRKLPDEIKKCIQKVYGLDIHQKILKNKEDFSNKKCSIVVTGETSAGKSSFLNLLLGEVVLHSSLLCSTRRLCHIHSIPAGSQWYFEVTMEDGSIIPHKKYEKNDKEKFVKDLEECVTSKDTSVQKVDIYWHVPLLGDNTHVTLVDSPGIGDNQELSEELLNYLPNASALIFVINSSNCGGVQGDKLGKIFSRLNSEIKDKNLFSFDPTCTMFILNKWDAIEQRRDVEQGLEEKVWNNTLDKLTENLTGFSWETCMYKMSTQDAITYRGCGMVNDKYRFMLTGLKQLVASSMSVNCKRHCRWLTDLIEEIQKGLTIRLADAKSKYEDNDKKYKDALLRLSQLRQDVDSIRVDLELKCSEKCKEMAAKMHDHIHSVDVQAQLKGRINIDIAPDEDLIKKSVLQQIDKLILEEVKDFEKREKIIATARDQIRMDINKKYHILIEKLVDVEKSIENKKSEGASEEELEMSIGGKVLIGVGLTIGIPVAVALGIALIPFTLPATIAVFWKRSKAIRRLLDHQEELKDECLKSVLQQANKDVFNKYVNEHHLPQLKKQMDYISNEIPRKIEGLEQQVKDMQNKRLSSKEIKEMYEPALESVKSMVFTLQKFNLTHISMWNIDVGRLRITKEICASDSLIVYAAKLCSDEEESTVVIKLLPEATTQNYLKIVEVLSDLRKTNHKNVVAFIGFCYTDCMPAIASRDCILTTVQFKNSRLMTVFEMCDTTLEDYMRNHNDLICGNTQKRTYEKSALNFFCTSGLSICAGMVHMYEQRLLHIFINLNNIMINKEHVKINPPMIVPFSIIQREWPRAPELATEQYTNETDVFYLGKVLWELWYGRKANGPTRSSADECERLPDCKLKHAMPEKLAQIVRKCWEANPKHRPSLSEVMAVLGQVQVM
ncbi:uncharacterized protein LOC127851083 isoform X2 [Dreissena polymorpha]|uniref:Protein kinase domain-containing protein n=2 Tax=Dreissena polymorpha TaxID=45954 RepID=A0A9D4CWT4_DREPO|nr:uncharacterized protein LOC127851083 isoform X2 [Dreissena polymorpha]XP_052240528.1 uncharacterized protein LOC127851083 isoform X2 [Dreissena polymorpha]XP_052240529.1 uncharacterized protein LOC127851083 isoform X2 [Dreissena polymorpha]XP_052240530.1 uncharacterized protein LOC127851083 isoform X2 [Dreissena polymorpha]KAH3734039.1 hypothetical protein DPMN_040478 [Dreissena polymorpha]